MTKLACLVLGAVLGTAAGGCASLASPNWGHPGTAECQQRRAEQFDPYPETHVAPTIVGARPLEYQSPLPEVQRARWLPWNWFPR